MGRLFWKFFFAILMAQVLATLGVGATFWLLGQARDRAALKAHGVPVVDTRDWAVSTLDAAAVAFKYGDVEGLREFIHTGPGARLYVLDAAGREMLSRPVSAELLAEAEHLRHMPDGQGLVRKFGKPGHPDYTAFVARARSELGPPRAGRAVFSGPPPVFGRPGQPGPHGGRAPGADRERHRLPYITMVVGTLASLVFAALLAWIISRPIRALRVAFAAAALGDLSPKFAGSKAGKGDELAQLGHEFDRMSGQLRALIENQRRLLHDVSHELRSPLARLHAAIGLAYQQPEKLVSSLDRIERESMRMDRLIGELLTLARLDGAMNLPPLEEIDIVELMLDIADDAGFEAAHLGRTVNVTAAGRGCVTGAPDLLWRGIENIVRNAVKYSPDSGVIDIDVCSSEDRVVIRVLDRGPGVAAEDLANIFRPFFRANSAANAINGHGLGLAIAQRVIAAHDGSLQADNRAGGGLCVTVTLPCHGAHLMRVQGKQ